jgi:hypothetical protein
MTDEIQTSKRDLVARVATLELLVADLVDALWRVDPKAMEAVARAASRDLEIQHNRVALQAGEHQRERLFTVLNRRRRMLKPRGTDEDLWHGGLGG